MNTPDYNGAKKLIPVEVAYATPERQELLALQVEEGTTALQAVRSSGIGDLVNLKDLESAPMGIFSRLLDGKQLPTPDAYVLQARDRVEIYRPLLIDPKSARVQRARSTKLPDEP